MATFVCLVMTSSLFVVCSAADADSGWGIATVIDCGGAGDAVGPQVAIDDSGNAIAVWVQYYSTAYTMYSNRYVVGTGWGTATALESPSSGDAGDPQVAVDSSGNATAVWSKSDGFRNSIRSNRYVVGVGWCNLALIETDNTGTAEVPQVTVDGLGNAIAVWQQSDGIHTHIWSNRFAVGAGWGTPVLIETDNTEDAENPQIAADESGNAVCVWHHYDGTRWNIWANRYVVGTGWGTAELIETDDTQTAKNPQVAVDDSGNAIAVWNQWDGTRPNIWANRYIGRTGSWDAPTLIETDDVGPASAPQVAVDGSGNAIAVWQQSDGTRYNIWSNRFAVGTGWGTATLIETDDAGWACRPEVAVDDSGNALVVWYQDDGTDYNIYSNRYVIETGWGTATLIETDNAGGASWPQVALDESGNAVAAWQESDGTTNRNIWANRFAEPDTTLPPLSLVTPANGLTTETPVITTSGTTEPGVSLVVNGISVAVESDGSFSCEIALIEGENTITATATDASDNSATVSVSVIYVNPVHELEEELEETRDELVDVREELNNTQDELGSLEDDLEAALEELSTTQDELDAAEEELAVVQNELDGTQDELDSLEDDLETTQNELDAVTEELNSTQAELNTTGEELDAVKDDLNTAEEELTSTSDDLNSVKSQNLALMAVLAIVAILAVVMSAMFMSLRKKIAGMDAEAADEEPPPPQS